jgi:putative flippase GtrA
VNTALGLSVIFSMMLLGVGDVTANAAGYITGFFFSFLANGWWTFGRSEVSGGALVRFFLVAVFAYGANLLALFLVRDVLTLGSHLGQAAGVVTYAAIGFAGAKLFAFTQRSPVMNSGQPNEIK